MAHHAGETSPEIEWISDINSGAYSPTHSDVPAANC